VGGLLIQDLERERHLVVERRHYKPDVYALTCSEFCKSALRGAAFDAVRDLNPNDNKVPAGESDNIYEKKLRHFNI